MFKDLINKNYFKKIIITIILKYIINKVGHFNFNDGKIFSMNSFYDFITFLFLFMGISIVIDKLEAQKKQNK